MRRLCRRGRYLWPVEKDNRMSLRIATYNIHKGVSGLGRKLRVHELRHALRSIDADIVFLQEVQDRNERLAARRKDYPDGRQVDFLASDHYEHSAYGMNAVYPHGHHGNAILSRLRIDHHRNHDISDHTLEQRGLLHAVVELRAPGRHLPLHLINVHLGLFKGGRERQARFMIDFVRREIPESAPLVIAGDFNDWQRRVDVMLREELGLGEVAAAQPRGPLIERLSPARETPRVARTFPAFMPWLSLDRIYLRGFSVAQASVPRGLAWARRSDHAPLIADVSPH